MGSLLDIGFIQITKLTFMVKEKRNPHFNEFLLSIGGSRDHLILSLNVRIEIFKKVLTFIL